MWDLVPFAVLYVLCSLGALVATGSRAQRAAGIALSLSALGTPWLLPQEHLIARSTLAIMAFCGAMRATDLRGGGWTPGERLWHALSVVDTRKLVRSTPTLELGALGRLLAWEALGGLAYLFVTRVGPGMSGGLYWAVRWGGALAFVYTLSEGAYCLLFATYRLAGFRPPLLHRHPAAARTVQEFWGRRWNLTVSAWLGETFFRPLARRGRPVAGVFLAFVVSALVHAYICEAAMGLGMALMMLAYFGAQGVVVAVELALGVSRWGVVPARVWTLAWMAGVSPVFTEPLLRVIGV